MDSSNDRKALASRFLSKFLARMPCPYLWIPLKTPGCGHACRYSAIWAEAPWLCERSYRGLTTGISQRFVHPTIPNYEDRKRALSYLYVVVLEGLSASRSVYSVSTFTHSLTQFRHSCMHTKMTKHIGRYCNRPLGSYSLPHLTEAVILQTLPILS